ncbi:MAG: diguanylate cyclase [Butyrivibrio sp.]|nr:diguanylate cyclase [Butyrivibrio sp.]
MMKKNYENSLKFHIILVCMLIIVFLCVVLSAISFYIFRTSLMDMYTSRLEVVVNITLDRIDAEDLDKCIETGQKSEKFEEMTLFLEQERKWDDLDYIVLTKPVMVDGKYDLMQVVSGLSEGEKAGYDLNPDIPLPNLGDMLGAFFAPSDLERLYGEMDTLKEPVYKVEQSDFGDEYGAEAIVRTADGKAVCMLSTGVSLAEVDRVLKEYVMVIALFALILAIVFAAIMVFWLQRRVIVPLQKIEKSASDFAKRSHLQKDPSMLVLEDPGIHTGDELESLSDTIVSMSKDMQSYVEEIIVSANKIDNMALEMTKVNDFALRDALTGVKNKAAYDKTEVRLNSDIITQTAKFGMIMVDINYLKRINDTFGHECGDLYIKNMCKLICDTFEHSPVFRIGGDEFVVLLENRDFEHRDMLIGKMKARMDELQNDKELQPWERISAAIGVAIYDDNIDETAYSVLKRADREMYENKKQMKAVRQR